MSDKKSKSSDKESEDNSEKIYFGEKSEVCFACGEKIASLTDKCPYCNTKQVL